MDQLYLSQQKIFLERTFSDKGTLAGPLFTYLFLRRLHSTVGKPCSRTFKRLISHNEGNLSETCNLVEYLSSETSHYKGPAPL